MQATSARTEPAATTYSPLDAQYADQIAQLQLRPQTARQASSMQRIASSADCSQGIIANADTMQVRAAAAQQLTQNDNSAQQRWR